MRSIQTTEIFDTWFTGLKDRQARVRIDHGPGGDKASQAKDIKTALQLAREL